LGVVLTLAAMAVAVIYVDPSVQDTDIRVNEIALETTLKVPGVEEEIEMELPPMIPGELSEENKRRPMKTEGLPPRPEPMAPLNDAEEWRAVRDEAARVWREDSLRGVEAYAAKAGLSADEREQAVNILLELHRRYEEIRGRLEDNTTTRDDAFVEIGVVDAWGKSQLEALLGEEGAELLRVELEANRTGAP